MLYIKLWAVPLALIASGTAFAAEPKPSPVSERTVSNAIVLSDDGQPNVAARSRTAARRESQMDEMSAHQRAQTVPKSFDAVSFNAVAASLPAHMLMTPEEAEAAGWPCTPGETVPVAKRTIATRNHVHHAAHALMAGQSAIIKAMLEAAHDCEDCPDCDDRADGTCTEASHKHARRYHCTDCPDAEAV